MIKKIDHLVITTTDVTRCFAFYQTLGFTPFCEGGRYALFAGDFKINVHQKGSELLPHAQTVQPGSADLCFELACDIASFQAFLKERHVEIELGAVTRSGVRGGMQSVYLRDPDGNLLEFCSYETDKG